MPEKTPPIQATKMMKKLMADHFLALDRAAAEGSPKVAWCHQRRPGRAAHSHGVSKSTTPENHGALLGASRMATDTIPVANALGYSPEICSYLTADVGAFIKGITPPDQGLRHQERAQARCTGVQHQPVPRRAGLVRVVWPSLWRPGHRGAHPPGAWARSAITWWPTWPSRYKT